MYYHATLKVSSILLFLSLSIQVFSQNVYSIFENLPENAVSNNISMLGEFDNRLLFFDDVAGVRKLWLSDGTPEGTFPLEPSGQTSIGLFSRQDDAMYFLERRGTDFVVSALLPGMSELQPVFTQPDIRLILLWNDNFYFTRLKTGTVSDHELVKYNPDDQALEVLFTSGFGGMRGLSATNNEVIFIANTAEGKMLGKTDGTLANTAAYHTLYPTGSEFAQQVHMSTDGEKMYFFYHPNNTPYNLWVTDGTSAGTQILKTYEFPAFGGLPARPFAFLGGQFFYTMREEGAPSGTTFKLHTTDGTPAGTTVLNQYNFYNHPRNLTVFDGRIFYNSLGAGNWSLDATNGTPAGTQTILSGYGYQSGSIGSISEVAPYRDSLVITGYDGGVAYGQELYITDGTLAGVRLLADIAPGTASSDPANFTQVGDKLFFTARVNNIRQLWVYDPATVVSCTSFAIDSISITNAINNALGMVSVEVSGGVPPYSFQLNDGEVVNTPVFENLPVGAYTLTINDQVGCELTFPFVIDLETGILDINLVQEFNVYPNPVKGGQNFTASWKTSKNIQHAVLLISNLNGVEQTTFQLDLAVSNSQQFSLPDLSAGNYVLSLWINGKRAANQLLTVVR